MRRPGAVLLAAALAALALAAPAEAADYVGLGDSYSSGTGTADSYTGNCERTASAYPTLIDAQLPGSGVNLSCSGARTNHITTDAQTPENPDAQVDLTGLGADTDVVTLEIGGNDAGFVDTMITCGNPFGDCDAAVDAAEQSAATDLPPKLAATYLAVRAKAPNATIVVVGYPRIFRPSQSCNTFFSANDVTRLNEAADLLDQLTRTAAHAKDFAYVSAIPAFIGHGACDSTEWINGLGTSNSFGNSYHPKAEGHQSGYFPAVLAGINAVPDTTLPSKPASLSNTANPQFQLQSTVANSTFQCKLDGGAFGSCTSPKSYTGLGEGSHTFTARAVNPNGDVDQFPVSYTWTIDTIAPSLTIDSGPAADSTLADDDATFAFTTNGATIQCKLDAASFGSCTSPTGQSYTGLSDGAHTFTVRATDAAGNAVSASRSWTIDTTAPVPTINSGPGNPTPEPDATFDFSVDDEMATTECRLDSSEEADFDDCPSPQEYTGLSDGAHVFEVRATDAVGNEATDSYDWVIDSASPAVSIDTAPNSLTNQSSATFAFSNELGTTTECKLDDGAFQACVGGTITYGDNAPPPLPSDPPLSDGPHTFTVKATDPALNFATDDYSWVVDTVAPGSAIGDSPPANTSSTAANFTFSSPDDPGATFECRLDSGQVGDFQPCTSPRQFSVGAGSHTFDVRAVDAAGNVNQMPAQWGSFSWNVDLTNPTASITGKPDPLTKLRTATFTFNATEPSSFECRLDSTQSIDFEACTSGKAYTGLGDGSHTFELRPTDAVGRTGNVVSYTWSIDGTAPTATITGTPDPLPAVSSADPRIFTFTSSEPGSSFECRLDSAQEAGFHSCTSPRTETGITDGSHTFEVRATDAAGNTGPPAAYSWLSDTTVPIVSIDSEPPPLTKQQQADFAFSAPNEPEAVMECRRDGQPFELCATNGSQSYSGLADGSHTFTVRATDPAGHSATDTSIWTVDGTPPVPMITGGPTGLTNQPSASFSFTVSGSPQTVECKLDGGTFSSPCPSPKVYGSLPDGSHTFTVRGTDAAGNVGSDSRSWTVDLTPPDTTIGLRPDSPTVETSAKFEFFSDDSGADFQCSLDGQAFTTCTPPVTYSGLALGDHSFKVRGRDAAGNLDPTPATHVWRIQPPSSGDTAGTISKKPRCKKKKKKRSKKRCKKKRRS